MEEEPIRTVRDALAWSQRSLGDPSGRHEIDRLLAHILDVPASEIYICPHRSLDPEQVRRFCAAWRERVAGKPLQYLLGETEFMSLRFRVAPGVFIPRPETECLVEAVVERSRGGVWVDVGTGAGVIAVSLAVYAPTAAVYATDLSRAALDLTAENATAHAVAERVRPVQADLLRAFRRTRWADGVVSNPPYVSAEEMESLPREVREHEPPTALFGGRDGLDRIRSILEDAPPILKPGGLLAMEIGAGQAGPVRSLLSWDPSWHSIEILHDLAGRPRVALAVRAA